MRISLLVATAMAALAVPSIVGCSSSSSSTTAGDGGTADSSTSGEDATPGDDGGTPTEGGGDAATASIRVVHAAPDAPKVDIWVQGGTAPVITGLAYQQASPYLSVPAGSYTFVVKANPSTASSPAVYTTSALSLVAGQSVTAIAAGLVGSTDASSSFRILAEVEGFTAPTSGDASVVVVHAGADAPSVGIDPGNADPSAPAVATLARFASTPATGVSLPAGQSLQVGIDPAGGGSAPLTAFTTPALTAGDDLFVIATGLLGKLPRDPEGFGLLVVDHAGVVGFLQQNPFVYALHDSPGAPTVDLYTGTTRLAAGLSFGNLSAPIQVPPSTTGYPLSVYVAGEGPASNDAGTAAAAGPFTSPALVAGQEYLVIATGFLPSVKPNGNTNAFQLDAFQEGFTLTDAANAYLTVIHGSPDAPAVDVGVVASGKITQPALISNLAFPSATTPATGLQVAPSSLVLGVAANTTPATTTPIETFAVTTTAGERAFVVAAGSLTGVGGNPFELIAINTGVSPWTATAVTHQ